MIRIAVVREELGIDTEILVDMYFHMAEDVIVDVYKRQQNRSL